MLGIPVTALILTLGHLVIMTLLFELARRVAGLFGGFGEGWRIIALLGHELTSELVERSLVALLIHRAHRLDAHGAGIREIVTRFLDCLEVAAQLTIFKNLIV